MRTAFIPSWLDDLELNLYEFRLYCHILRRGELYGSNANICKICKIERKKLFETIVSLESKNLIKVTRTKGMTNRITALQPSPKTEHLPSPDLDYPPSPNLEQEVVRKRNTKDTPIKETPIKEKKQKPLIVFPFESERFKTTWQAWKDERKERRKPLTKRAIVLQIGRMQGFTENEVITAINLAIEKQWATFYPQKEMNYNQPRSTTETLKLRGFND